MNTKTFTDGLWFTSDNHFFHKRIQELDDEPKHEDRTAWLIEKWNNRVQPDDTIWHLGDFSFGGKTKTREIFSQLNGRINVLSNHFHHDSRWLPKQPNDKSRYEYGPLTWESASGHPISIYPPLVVLEIPQEKLPSGIRNDDTIFPLVIVLCHCPFKTWDRRHYGSWHLYGHTHQKENKIEEHQHSLYVGIQAFNYEPVSFDRVTTAMIQRGWYPGWTQYG